MEEVEYTIVENVSDFPDDGMGALISCEEPVVR